MSKLAFGKELAIREQNVLIFVGKYCMLKDISLQKDIYLLNKTLHSFNLSTKPMKNVCLLALGLLLLFAWTACQEQDSSSTEAEAALGLRELAPPMDNVRVPPVEFTANVSEADYVHTLENGSQLRIPQGALVDEQGQAVEGEVDMRYSEFHDVADILLSGIPMAYDSAGETHILQSAGMIEVRASQNGKPVFIAEGKEIEIEMASYQEGSYNLYSLDDASSSWEYLQTAAPVPNPRRTAVRTELPEMPAKPVKPEVSSEDNPSFPIDADFRKYPELAHFKDLDWQWAGIEEDGCTNPTENDWVFGEIWKAIKLAPKDAEQGLYYLYLANPKHRVKMLVKPSVTQTNYASSMEAYEAALQKRETVLAQIEQERQRQQMQAELVRTFSIQQFGIYNWDLIMKMPERQEIMADFEFDAKEMTDNMFAEVDKVFLIMPEQNSVIPYVKSDHAGPGTWGQFAFSPAMQNKILAILPGGKAAVFDEVDFANARIGERHTFKMRTLPTTIQSSEDLKSLLGV